MGFTTLEEITKAKQGMSEKKNEIQVKMEFNPKYVDGVEETELKEEDLSVVSASVKDEDKVVVTEKANVEADTEDLF